MEKIFKQPEAEFYMNSAFQKERPELSCWKQIWRNVFGFGGGCVCVFPACLLASLSNCRACLFVLCLSVAQIFKVIISSSKITVGLWISLHSINSYQFDSWWRCGEDLMGYKSSSDWLLVFCRIGCLSPSHQSPKPIIFQKKSCPKEISCMSQPHPMVILLMQ